ncbi:hypothetical protein [Neobacillus cucumis]|uniref:hypothetical protein n=1 Tax=Neobacillus cucumis TaxID=1740721 RepID=UPI001966C670|nr:hypothetical protein [Neobacillus cucumis]MBM7652186.1 hypothetical protein [Neobacillus cucumis]
MKVVYYFDNEIIYKTKTDDLSGLISAIEKSDMLPFKNEIYYLDHFRLNHYLSEKDHWKEAFNVYLKKQES